jgi:Peptidase inhibitor family I36
MGNAVAGSEAENTHYHSRGGQWFRTLGPGLHVVASVAVVIVATQMTALPAAGSGPHGRHCVARLGTSQPTMRCFAALNAAVAAATNGRMQLPSDTTGADLRSIPLNGAAAPGNYDVVSIEWTGSTYTGSSLTWEAPSPCGTYANASMPRGWNDTIRSVAQYSGCATTLYWDINFGGATRAIDVNASVPDLGNFDANTSSQKWCPVLGCS